MTGRSTDDWRGPTAPPQRQAGAPGSNRGGHRTFLAALLVILVALGILGAYVAFRYVPLIGQSQELRATAARLAAVVKETGLAELETTGADRIKGELALLDQQLEPFRDVMDNDPLVGLGRALPVIGDQVTGAEAIVRAVDELVQAGDIGVALLDRFRELRARSATDPSANFMAGVVELMATSGDQVATMDALIAAASARLDSVPAGAVGQVQEARAVMREPLDRFAPLLSEYAEVDDVLPGILGWGGEKRYLVLAQNPAELRPTGGYTGTVGIIAFQDGKLVERRFFNVYQLDTKPDMPYVEPPAALREFLLGEGQSWRLADANWSPDFPTSAQDARRHYALESGDQGIDGVFAMTTFALDRILEVTGPVEVPEFGVTVNPGDVTMTILAATRESPDGTTDRKAVLDALAETTLERLLSLPAAQWVPLFGAIEGMGRDRLAMAWFEDPAAQALVDGGTWSGAVRTDPGDYLAVVDSNVAPTSKYNLVVERSTSLTVDLSESGDATSVLKLGWRNDAGLPGEPYASIREFSQSQEGIYGAYVRVLVPEGAELVSATGRAMDAIEGVESIGTEAGRTTFANFLLMPPGDATLTYFWTREGAAQEVDGVWEYRLTVQKQAGMLAEPVTIRIRLPDGATVTEVSDGVEQDGERLTLTTSLTQDLDVLVRYTLPPPVAESPDAEAA